LLRRPDSFGERAFRALLKHEVERINEHLPSEFRTLSELLSMECPSVRARDGGEIIFDRGELEYVASILPRELHDKLTLPIVLMRRIDLGPGVFSVSGGKVEAYVALKVLNEGGEVDMDRIQLPLYIYRPQVQVLRRRLRGGRSCSRSWSGYLGMGGSRYRGHRRAVGPAWTWWLGGRIGCWWPRPSRT